MLMLPILRSVFKLLEVIKTLQLLLFLERVCILLGGRFPWDLLIPVEPNPKIIKEN
jgi:hypothetical protein